MIKYMLHRLNDVLKRRIFTKSVKEHRTNAYRSIAWFPSSAKFQQLLN